MANASEAIDEVTFARKWAEVHQSKAPAELTKAAWDVPSALNLDYYVSPVIEAARKRKLIYAATDLINRAQEKSADQLLSDLETTLQNHSVVSHEAQTASQMARMFIDDCEARSELKGALSGIATGFYDLDEKTDGLQPEEQTIIAARPSVGKTALMLNMVDRICLRDKIPTLIITIEMRTEALLRRLFSAHESIDMKIVRSGSYTKVHEPKMACFPLKINKSPLWCLDFTSDKIDVTRICATAKRLIRMHGIKVVFLDYIQKVRCSGQHEKRTYQVAEVSQSLNALAKSTHTAVVTLAQLNREPDRDKGRVPRLSDLADSGQLERDGDLILLLHRSTAESSGKASIIVAKQRDGETGLVNLRWNGPYCRFENATSYEP
jgi:replicative DNA helicase